MSAILAFAVSVRLSKKSLVVRTLASLLMIALLAPATLPLRAKAEAKGRAEVSVSAAAMTGNLAAPEPMSFPGIAGHGDKGEVLHRLGEQWQQLQTAHWNVIKWAVSAFSHVSLLGAVALGASAKSTAVTSPNSTITNAATAKSVSIASSPSMPPTATTAFDFDGDDKADIAFWRPSDGTWWVLQSSTQELTMRQWGAAGDRIVPADYDGDGKTDYAVYTPSGGMWNVLLSSNGQLLTRQWGTGNDVPVASDFDGDGKADIAVWRPSNGVWYIVKSSDSSWYAVSFGYEGDIPVAGDYDGDGKADAAVWRPSNGVWYIQQSLNGFTYYSLGSPGDIPMPADYDADGKTDFAVHRPSNNTWYIINSANGAFSAAQFGISNDVLVPADYDGDGKADIAVWRPSSGIWYIWRSSTSALWYTELGVSGNIPVPAAYIKQPGATPTPTTTTTTVSREALAAQRLAPINATGGTNLYSRNFSWGTGLVGLPGRAGLDAGLSLSYNSLVWTKVGNTMVFDADKADVTPGFRFGFPVIEPVYTDPQTNKPTYLMVTPSGGRTELRQTATSNLYESADSSYLQIEVTGTGSQEQRELVLRTIDGTQMKYVWRGDAYRCKEIKDSNGNFITVNHDSAGLLRSIKDTLGRVINVNYDSTPDPISITQTLASGATHTWATFSYATKTINYNFGGLGVAGPVNNTAVKVLNRVTFTEGGYYSFEYNSYGQVSKINKYGASGNWLHYVAPEYQNNPSSPDIPRLSATKSKASNFNNGDEVTAANVYLEGQSYSVPGASSTATLVQVTAPDGTIDKTFVYPAGDWKEGLPVVTETWSGGERKRWTWTNWTQDNESLGYKQNPRVTETKVGDAGSTRKTTISYHSQFGLVNEVREFDSNGTTVLRKTATDYNLESVYTNGLANRPIRIIGLPKERRLYEGESALMSKVTFAYDGGGFTEAGQNISPVQQDATNYGAGFVAGRGNLTSTTRWDVTAPTDAAKAVTSTVKYNTAGSPVSSTDPAGRTTGVSYDDKFVNNQYALEAGRNTFAYPTTLTDAAAYSSTIKYRFDFGATMEAQSPPAAGQTQGRTTQRKYDSYGRLEKVTTVNNNAYTRYVYGDNQEILQTYSTLVNINEPNNPNDDGVGTEDEVKSETYLDGFGRARATLTEHPGSAGGFTGQLIEYDSMGRVKRSTAPTEINSNWQPAGDDYRVDAQGNVMFLWMSQEYDWKGRVTREINTDGTDRLISYEGCGCAGGQKTTIQSELVPRDDMPNTNARRTQKIYADILGRTVKTEVMNWDGVTACTTTVNTFNGRDQVTKISQYAGAESSSNVRQDVTTTYDGHGRMKTRHYPIEDAAANTTWIYNADDSVHQTIDPRGAATNYAYNSRGLVEQISYAIPSGSSIPPTPTANFLYDAAGNRTQMTTVNVGATVYAYNELSQLTAETKTFTGLTGNFTIGYGYHIGGGVKSITDPFQSTVNYAADKTGRLTGVSGTPFGNNASGNYADNIQYRAFGAIKQMNYKTDDNALVSMQYDNRLRVSGYQVASAAVTDGFVQKSGYEYFADSRPKAMDNVIDAGFDRTFKYDHAGRLTNNQFGMATRPDGQQFMPYSQTIQYDAFSNMTNRQTTVWSGVPQSYPAAYTNGRQQSTTAEPLIYDASGNVVDITYSATTYRRNKFDAAGRHAENSQRRQMGGGQTTYLDITTTIKQIYDGDGERVKQINQDNRILNNNPPVFTETASYYVRSTVTGKTITELNAAGNKLHTNVYVGEAVLARQTSGGAVWIHADPVTGSVQEVTKSGTLHTRRELEPLGGKVPTSDPNYTLEIDEPNYNQAGDISGVWGCVMPDTGMPAPCNVVAFATNYSDRITPAGGSLGNHFSRQLMRTTVPGFVSADNRRDDELERIPGLRRVPEYDGREFIGSMWAVDNSVAAQGQTKQDINEENLKNWYVKEWGKTFDECLQGLIKNYINNIKNKNVKKKEIDRLNNMKAFNLADIVIDGSLTAQQVIDKYHPALKDKDKYNPVKAADIGGTVDVARNAIIIPKEIFTNPKNWSPFHNRTNILFGNVSHEAGNLASAYLFSGDYYALGRKDANDPDAGQAMMVCMINAANAKYPLTQPPR